MEAGPTAVLMMGSFDGSGIGGGGGDSNSMVIAGADTRVWCGRVLDKTAAQPVEAMASMRSGIYICMY